LLELWACVGNTKAAQKNTPAQSARSQRLVRAMPFNLS
jgi:hypothetical protein